MISFIMKTELRKKLKTTYIENTVSLMAKVEK